MYPKIIQVENDKLKDLILKKAELIERGRGVSVEIEALEKEMKETDEKVKVEEKKVDIKDILEKEKTLVAQLDVLIKEMEGLKKQIFDKMSKEVPKELHDKYDKLVKDKEDKEEARNKIALKAQKYNDKIIPLARNMMKPFLEDMYEDFDSLYVENGEIVATIFSHLQDFKNNFKKK